MLTAALILALLALGHTRRAGSRRRVVKKAADWLAAHHPTGAAVFALECLDRVEAGGPGPAKDDLALVEPALRRLLGDDDVRVVMEGIARV